METLFIISCLMSLTVLRQTDGERQRVVLPLKAEEEEEEVVDWSVLLSARLHQRNEESFHLASCWGREGRRWVGGWREGTG